MKKSEDHSIIAKNKQSTNSTAKILNFFSRIRTGYLIMIFVLFGWICLMVGYVFRFSIFGNLLLPSAFLSWGFSGLPMITRQEVPQFGVNGTLAIIYGAVLAMLGLLISGFIFYAVLSK